jgi:hypothetical protein
MASQRLDIDYNLSTFISTLNIRVTRKIDLGSYHVLAENIAGKVETSCKLFIKEVPNIDETAYVNPDSFKPFEYIAKPQLSFDDDGEHEPVIIVRPLEDQECYEGDTVTFVCEVRGHPKPQVNIK